jgi:hypothetical protein
MKTKHFIKSQDSLEAQYAWMKEHVDELVRQYNDQWVAVKGRRVIASAEEIMEVLSRVPDRSETCIEFISRRPRSAMRCE